MVLTPEAHYVAPGVQGAFQSVKEAINWGVRDVPVTVPRAIVPIALRPGVDHFVDRVLPRSHSFCFFTPGTAILSQYTPTSALSGNLGVDPYQQADPPNTEKTRVLFHNVCLGNGTPNSLIFDARYGWEVFGDLVLVYGMSFRVTHDAGITGSRSGITLSLNHFGVNSFQDFQYVNDAQLDPPTRFVFRNGSMFGVPDSPSRYSFRARLDAEFENIDFLTVTNPGKVFGATAGTTGVITFDNTRWSFLPFFGPLELFDANMGGVQVEWIGRNVFSELPAAGTQPIDFGNTGANTLAPELIAESVPTSPPLGTRRRDVGGTEKDLFWNGALWV